MKKLETLITIFIVLGVLVMFFIFTSQEKEQEREPVKKYEKYYQEKMCKKLDGVIEHRLEDRTRVDCLTDDYAIEVDFAKKWAESIGQALFYAQMTGKDPAIGLIVGEKDTRYLKRLRKVTNKFDIKVFVLEK